MISFYHVYIAFQLAAMGLCIYTVCKITQARPSRAQVGSILFALASVIYVFGFLLEVTAADLGSVLTAVKVEYFGELFLVIGFTWFFAEFCRIALPKIIYWFEAAFSVLCIYLLFTTEENHIFYKSMAMEYSGPSPRLVLEYGVGFYLFVGYVAVMCCGAACAFLRAIKHGTRLEKCRCGWMLCALVCPWLPLAIRATGITGGYEVSFLGVMGSAICIMNALLRYEYFDSVQLAGENALFNSNEGIVIVDTANRILYFNGRIKENFPMMKKYDKIDRYMEFDEILRGHGQRVPIRDALFDVRAEQLNEMGENQGYLIRALDMTEHYNRLDQAEMSAHVDALTGLWDREQFKISMLDELYQNGSGTMFMMDVDNFKEINDHYGHDIGDKVLRTLGTAVSEICQNEHFCGRLGGDEFCLFLKGITEEAEIQKYAKGVASLYKEKIALLPEHVKSSMSIGVVAVDIGKHNTARDTFEQIYRSADEAMYRSKRNGKDTWQICTYRGEAEHGAQPV